MSGNIFTQAPWRTRAGGAPHQSLARTQARRRQGAQMYKRIIAPIDNSPHSDEAVKLASSIAERFGSTVFGFHAYAARLHERRFTQMEPGLPERYQTPDELERQRSTHESLISNGLQIISESYLDHAQELCREREVPFERQMAEGKNYVEVLSEIDRDGYDLVAMGAVGLGAVPRSLIGGVSERVLRGANIDVVLVRKSKPNSNGIMAAVDGSPESFKAVESALALGAALEQPVEVVSVYDPEFHIVAFKSVADVLSDAGAELFRFDDQQKLHEEIIDRGLETLYQGHLDTAAKMGEAAGQRVTTTLLEGKPFQRMLDHADERNPTMLVIGRFGLHKTDAADIGSTCENLARLARCSVLVSSGRITPEPIDDSADDESIPWSADAEERLQNVPPFARNMARQAIEEYARDGGHDEVTLEVMDEARERMGM
ncbi:MAG TPA: hypothetical protein DCP37_09295 [Dehalococcoidia bacterium]|nr:hypothetical protein [Dehalococcoidia bacterium]